MPDPFQDAFVGMIAARALTTATRLGLFDALAEEPAAPGALARRLGADPLGVEVLLTALLSLGYVERERQGATAGGGRFRLSDSARRHLASSSPEGAPAFYGEMNAHQWEMLGELDEAVRTGRARDWHGQEAGHPLWRPYIRGLFELSRPEQDASAALVPVEDPELLVDVAGGHGGFAMAMCRRHPDLRALVVDLPAAVRVGREIVEEEGYAERITFIPGDVFEVGLGFGVDVVSAFNLVHHLSPEQCARLFEMAKEALNPGGCLVVGDTERPEPGEPVSQVGALTGLLFYAMSRSRTHTRAELVDWLERAGFGEIAVHRNERSPWRVVVVGKEE